jgi:hypothetical protein
VFRARLRRRSGRGRCGCGDRCGSGWRGVRRLRRDRPALADIEAQSEQPPLSVDRRKQHFEIHLLRHGREKSGHAHHAVRLDLRQDRQLWIDDGDARQIDIVANGLRKFSGCGAIVTGGSRGRS